MKLLHQRQRLFVDRAVIADHFLSETAYCLVVRAHQRPFASRDVEIARGISNMRDLRIGGESAAIDGVDK